MNHHLGRFIWRELVTKDVARSKAFYEALLGWRYEDTESGAHGAYTMIYNGDKGVGGIMAAPQAAIPTHWESYVSVADVDASIAAAKEHGGGSHWGPHDLPTIGRIAGVQSFDRASLAVIKPIGPDQPRERPSVGEFCWETLTTDDIDRSRTFWISVAGWMPSTGMGIPTFAVGQNPEDQVADIQKAQGGVPPHWLTFVVVSDLDAACKRVNELRGKIVIPAMAVGEMGRMAVTLDDQGASIGLFQSK
jgi:uncharacterized protein